MNPKQKRFADEYLIDLNATAAYKRAGYKGQGNSAESAASQLLSNLKVSQYVQGILDKRSEDLGIDQRYVLTAIKETVERCRQSRPVLNKAGQPVMVETDDGELVPAYEFDATNVLKGAELLGRHINLNGFSKDNKDSQPATNNTLVIMGDDNRLEIARRLAFILARGAKMAK